MMMKTKKKMCQLTIAIMHELRLQPRDVINPIENNEGRVTRGT